MVNRYEPIIRWDLGSDPEADMSLYAYGGFVTFEDYEALRQQAEALADQVNRLARAYADLTDKQCYNITKQE